MPWLSLILGLLAFLSAKSNNPGNKSKALLTGVAAGLGTYAVTHETDWGKSNLGSLDGLAAPKELVRDEQGNVVPEGYTRKVAPDGTVSYVAPAGFVNELGQTLRSWGGTGTSAVIGTTKLATSPSTLDKVLPWALGGLALFFLFSK